MANDVAPFLFQPTEVIQVQNFPSYLRSIRWNYLYPWSPSRVRLI
jgi:hypothetical protein